MNAALEIERLRLLLVACRSSVKFDLLRYERLLDLKKTLKEETVAVEAEARRLHILGDQIDDSGPYVASGGMERT